jgi:hypothetical protein
MVRHTGEDFIDAECITVASVFSFQATGIYCIEHDAPEANCSAADGNTSLGEKILDIAVNQVESVVEPDGVGDNIGWEVPTVTLEGIDATNLAISGSYVGATPCATCLRTRVSRQCLTPIHRHRQTQSPQPHP